MDSYLFVIVGIVADFGVWLVYPPAENAKWVWFPTGRKRRFRFRSYEGDEPEKLAIAERPKCLDPSLATTLRLQGDVDTTVRVDHDGFVKLIRLRARFVGDVLEVRVRHWPELFLLVIGLGLGALFEKHHHSPWFLLLAPPVILFSTLWRSSHEADFLVLELLELAKPRPVTEARELDAHGSEIDVRRPRDQARFYGEILSGRPGAALLAIASVFATPVLGGLFLLGVAVFSFARNLREGVLGALMIVAFGLLAVLSLAGLFLGVRRFFNGRWRRRARKRER